MGCKFTVQSTVEQRPALEVGCTITAEVLRELVVMLKDQNKQLTKKCAFFSLSSTSRHNEECLGSFNCFSNPG